MSDLEISGKNELYLFYFLIKPLTTRWMKERCQTWQDDSSPTNASGLDCSGFEAGSEVMGWVIKETETQMDVTQSDQHLMLRLYFAWEVIYEAQCVGSGPLGY